MLAGGSRLLTSVRRYTRFVLFSKWLLWVLALAMLIAVVATGWINSGDHGARLVFTSAQKSANSEVVMLNPYYQGVDKNNQPFNVVADTATQKDPDTVVMHNVRADLTLKDSRWLALTAKQGVLKLNQKKVDLAGDVDLFYDGGYEMRSQTAKVDIEAGTVEGPDPVEVQGPPGTLKSDRFRVLEKGQVMWFEGHVKVVLDMSRK